MLLPILLLLSQLFCIALVIAAVLGGESSTLFLVHYRQLIYVY